MVGESEAAPDVISKSIIAHAKRVLDDPAVTWRCYFCDETFTDPKEAGAHFGAENYREPLCKLATVEGGLAAHIAGLESEVDKLRRQAFDEDSAAERAHFGREADHARALVEAEQKGYERGLRDAGLPETIAEIKRNAILYL